MPLVEYVILLHNMVWIDIEQSQYVDRTISLYRAARSQFPNVGLCLQSYLHRTEKDPIDLLPLSPLIRLVKGAYAEPPSVAYRKKSEVNANYLRLSKIVLAGINTHNARVGIATHDRLFRKRSRWDFRRARKIFTSCAGSSQRNSCA